MKADDGIVAFARRHLPAAEFFQIVRLLEDAELSPGRVGGPARPEEEALRFRAWDNPAFAPRDLIEIARSEGDDGLPLRLTVAFMGLHGPASPLPAHVTERAMADDEAGENLRDFLDVFNHRAVSLLVRIWRKYRYFLEFTGDGADGMSRRIFAIAGLPRDCEALFGPLDPVRLLPYAGSLAMATAPASAIETVVSHYLHGIGARVEPLVARTVTVPDEQRTRLGTRASQLGETMIVGHRVRDVSGKFRLHIGPIGRADFAALLPGQALFEEVVRLVRLLVRDRLSFDLVLHLWRDDAPPWRLGAHAPDAIRLGYNAWAGQPKSDPAVVLAADESTDRDDAR